ncbi:MULTISPECIES: hypothetical protein [unclassified Lactococcus]|nr:MULTISPECIES: hypothetical protein [unclassified Lactococcus]
MNEVISISDEKVMIGSEDGTAKEYPVSSLNYQGVRVGDKVKVYE